MVAQNSVLKNRLEKSRSWSSAHDWKSCNGYKPFEGSNPSFSAKTKPSLWGGFCFAARQEEIRTRKEKAAGFRKKIVQWTVFADVATSASEARECGALGYPSFSAKKEVTFIYQKLLLFYPSRRLGISSRVSVYIIAAGAYHQPMAALPAA